MQPALPRCGRAPDPGRRPLSAAQRTLWISTPSVHWKIFPAFLTARAARGFGHVRNGYSLAELHARLPAGLQIEATTWDEPTFRFLFAALRVVGAVSSPLTRDLAGWCYHLDRRRPEGGALVRARAAADDQWLTTATRGVSSTPMPLKSHRG